MSIAADFAQTLHTGQQPETARALRPAPCPSLQESLQDIRVAVFDVYGTLINYWKEEFGNEARKEQSLRDAFAKTIGYFKLTDALIHMNPDEAPAKTLYDLYHGLIALKHGLAAGKGVSLPEIKIEQVWETILLMCKRHGFDYAAAIRGTESDCACCMAYYYNFFAIGRQLYPGVYEALRTLREKNILLGIVSNAQFYTPIDLTLLLRDSSRGTLDDYNELFENDLVFYSYEYGVSKPDNGLFRKLFDALYELQILPSQTVFVGNDFTNDIGPAQKNNMKTALFTGDDRVVFNNGACGGITPDLVFEQWSSLPDLLSFHHKEQV